MSWTTVSDQCPSVHTNFPILHVASPPPLVTIHPASYRPAYYVPQAKNTQPVKSRPAPEPIQVDVPFVYDFPRLASSVRAQAHGRQNRHHNTYRQSRTCRSPQKARFHSPEYQNLLTPTSCDEGNEKQSKKAPMTRESRSRPELSDNEYGNRVLRSGKKRSPSPSCDQQKRAHCGFPWSEERSTLQRPSAPLRPIQPCLPLEDIQPPACPRIPRTDDRSSHHYSPLAREPLVSPVCLDEDGHIYIDETNPKTAWLAPAYPIRFTAILHAPFLPESGVKCQFVSVEHYVWACKAAMLGRTSLFKALMRIKGMASKNMAPIRALGLQLDATNDAEAAFWRMHMVDVLRHGNRLKFEQNEMWARMLLQTGSRRLLYDDSNLDWMGPGLHETATARKMLPAEHEANFFGLALESTRHKLRRQAKRSAQAADCVSQK
ncbi:hypothetical protein BV25DRAFT_777946 [Artomyces pyxidatus]|uniref:Uncharacterized protein n=1 Tax=Artomyces pyxidatus TaxID=48021 RepID=A0ACB8SYS0_9AGAM|nr:hypothetical protein BV25DRAFT_777946 [Artomyces pyxidatus]